MTRYEQLLNDIDESEILYIETTSTKQPAKSMRDAGDYAIFMNERAFKAEDERLEALMHEKGHCDSGAFYSVYTPLITRARCECRAWRRAVLDNLPFEVLEEACEACKTAEGIDICDVSDYLDMPASFIDRACEEYKLMGKEIFFEFE